METLDELLGSMTAGMCHTVLLIPKTFVKLDNSLHNYVTVRLGHGTSRPQNGLTLKQTEARLRRVEESPFVRARAITSELNSSKSTVLRL